ncbi:hypothetical protein [Labedaea rhizosphaerae]|uniref:Glycosyl hydrolase family 26 n=1 Tax=Labedaea rhizosphaerae TaxID=598644 RepID=A0A4R6RXQ9_LABRH|nr:hypothetical protein [Labedaea rhizosphaerae]TDP91850.1 hypothetical protein EV186_10860 [Labedaea rhizosphaerae]
MRSLGINYDTGFLPGTDLSRKVFTEEAVRTDLTAIMERLHCQSVRVSGGHLDRIDVAARCAAELGLEVWYAPFPVDLTPEETLAVHADGARRAQRLRETGAEVVYVAGCEASLFGKGFVPGETWQDRIAAMGSADEAFWSGLGEILGRLNGFLAQVAATVRASFDGKLTYAAGPWEYIDWTPFDYVGSDGYRASYNAEKYPEEIRALTQHGKPVAITEFGTCAYRGAGELGGMAWQPPEGAVPDEHEQVRYLTELLDVFDAEGVDTALWFTFASFNAVGADDLRSYGVVRMLDDTNWEPKAVFHAMAERYAR